MCSSDLFPSHDKTLEEVHAFLVENESNIQCVVAKPELGIENSLNFGEAQNPSLNTYADNIDTMAFLSVV